MQQAIQALSTIFVVLPFNLTDEMPASLAEVEEYIWLTPIIWPFVAFNTKKGSFFIDVFFSYLASIGLLLCTDAIPPWAAVFD